MNSLSFDLNIPDSSKIASGAIVIGDVIIGNNVGIWYNAVVRSEEGRIIIGDNTNIQDCAVIHLDPGGQVNIGDGVTVGHGAIVHGATVGDNTVVGMGATILNDAMIGDDCIIAAGALVPGGMMVPDGSLVVGVPGRIVRKLSEEEVNNNRINAEHYVSYISSIM